MLTPPLDQYHHGDHMKQTIFFFLAGTILTTACSIPTIQTSWSKPGAQPGEFERDHRACEDDQSLTGLSNQGNFQVCMKKKGWFFIEEPVP